MERQERDVRAAAAPATTSDRGYVDWGSILAGAVIAAGVSAVLTGFGAALGLGSISAREGEGLGFGSVILTGLYLVLSMVAAYWVGGYIAGRMRRRTDSATPEESATRDGVHGLAVWGIGTIVSAMMLSTAVTGTVKAAGDVAGTAVQAAGSAAGGLAQGAGNLIGGAMSGVGQAVQGAAQGAEVAQSNGIDLPNPLDAIGDRLLRSEAQAPDQFSNENLRREIGSILADVVRTGELSDQDRAYLRGAIATRTQLQPAEVDARIDQAVNGAQELRAQAEQVRQQAERALEEAKQTAVDAAETARQAAVLSAFAIAAAALVAAVAAFIGGQKGGLHRDEGRVWGGLTHRPLRRR